MNKQNINHPRRNFMRVCAAGAGVAALGAIPGTRDIVKAAPLANHKRFVIINLIGGNDGLNTVFPSTGSLASTYQTRRGTLSFTGVDGLALTGGPNVPDFRLHPVLDTLQSVWDANQLAIIQKVGYPSANLSHFVSEDIWSTAVRSGHVTGPRGWIARYANQHAATPTGVMSFRVGKRLDFEGAAANPLLIGSVEGFRYEADTSYSNNHILRLATYGSMLAQQPATGLAGEVAAIKNAAHNAAQGMQQALTDYNTYAGGTGISYPTTGIAGNPFVGYLGRGLRDIAALIYAGFDTRIFYTALPGGFDTHGGQEPRHSQLLGDLDDSLAAFVADLQGMGAWNDTVIFINTEFGRRNYSNGSDGTDHGHGNAAFVLGGAVTGGMYGDPPTVNDLNGEYLPYTTDFRDIYRHILQDHLGHNAAAVFPEAQPITNSLSFL